jgi:phosphoesterase RecJ-like protein
MRSKGRVDLSGLARSLGGGGHKNAAGSVLDGTLEEVRTRVISEVEKVIAAHVRSGSIIAYGRHS